jgi:hypothetical protein
MRRECACTGTQQVAGSAGGVSSSSSSNWQEALGELDEGEKAEWECIIRYLASCHKARGQLSKHGAPCHGVLCSAYRTMQALAMHVCVDASHRFGLSYLKQMLLY